MSLSCSSCSFKAHFESALNMHRQLHHDTKDSPVLSKNKESPANKTASRTPSLYPITKSNIETKSLGRSSSATRLLDKLRARICRSRTLFSHPEENLDDLASIPIDTDAADKPMKIACAPKVVPAEPSISLAVVPKLIEEKERFGCHLCSFEADRITVLDRHLLNYHKIGLESLLILVMAKTKDGLSDDAPNMSLYGIRGPYYRPPDEIIEDGEFIIETVTPKIKILKHSGTNTDDLQLTESFPPDLKTNCKIITAELEKLINCPLEHCDKDEFLGKMQTLNECMCKFVDSSNTLKTILSKELDPKHSVCKQLSSDQNFFNLCLEDGRNSSRVWERSRSETMDRSRNKPDKKFTSESFYF